MTLGFVSYTTQPAPCKPPIRDVGTPVSVTTPLPEQPRRFKSAYFGLFGVFSLIIIGGVGLFAYTTSVQTMPPMPPPAAPPPSIEWPSFMRNLYWNADATMIVFLPNTQIICPNESAKTVGEGVQAATTALVTNMSTGYNETIITNPNELLNKLISGSVTTTTTARSVQYDTFLEAHSVLIKFLSIEAQDFIITTYNVSTRTVAYTSLLNQQEFTAVFSTESPVALTHNVTSPFKSEFSQLKYAYRSPNPCTDVACDLIYADISD